MKFRSAVLGTSDFTCYETYRSGVRVRLIVYRDGSTERRCNGDPNCPASPSGEPPKGCPAVRSYRRSEQ